MMELGGSVAIITGAGGAIGEATARLFAGEGAAVVLADVRKEGIEEIAREAETNPEIVTSAPHITPVRRLDESAAARNLDVNYQG